MSKIFDAVKPGVLFGDDVAKVYAIAKENKFALPAVNVVGSDSVNGVLEAAASVNSPVIIQFSSGGASFAAGAIWTFGHAVFDETVQGMSEGRNGDVFDVMIDIVGIIVALGLCKYFWNRTPGPRSSAEITPE